MRQEQQRKFDSLGRVRDFARTRPEAAGALAGSPALAQLDGAITAIAGHVLTQGTADRSLAGQISRQRALVQELIRRHITPIAKFARAKLRGTPGFAELTFKPDEKRPAALVRAARSMAVAAAPYADALVAAGFPADAIATFSATIDTLADTIAQRGHFRHVRVGSTKGIEEQLRLGREAVKLLDAVLTRQFAFDATFLAAWKSATRIDKKSGSVRAVSASEADAPSSAKASA